MSDNSSGQKIINQQICDILTAIVHSDDNYERGTVDLSATALLQKLYEMVYNSSNGRVNDE